MSEPTENQNPEHHRRVRYSGTHPKKFGEKYKELNPEKYQEDVEKVKMRGQTPAGSHRPICVDEILEALKISPGLKGVDCTLGYGGHTREILERLGPEGLLIGLDVDAVEQEKTISRLRGLGFDEKVFQARHLNFSQVATCLEMVPEGFDFILADLGVSSMQLDTPQRGFSYKNPAPLDLRLDPTSGETAGEFLRRVREDDLIEMLRENADEPQALLLGKAICRQRNQCQTTKGLAGVIEEIFEIKGLRKEELKSTYQRVFQALRIEVNHEFSVLNQLLESLPRCLKSGGRVAILTFHSGEDRRVKLAFKEYEKAGIFSEVVRRPLRPSGKERHDNPRSSPAKLRWAVKA